MGKEETIWAAAGALRAWIERYGVPLKLYVDWKNLYKRCATAQERLRGEEPITQFGSRVRGTQLGIELIAARSPQAKGRVEIEYGGRAVPWREIPAASRPSLPPGEARDRAARRADSGQGEAEGGAAAQSPVARGGAPRDGRGAAVFGLALRFALNARPTGSQGFAPGKAKDKNKSKNQKKRTRKRGHF